MKDKDYLFDIILIFILGLIPLLWFRPGYELLGGYDFTIFLNPLQELKENVFLWRERFAAGLDNTYSLPVLPYFFLYAFPQWLGFSLYTAQKLVFIILFSLPGLAMYYLVRVLFKNELNVRIISLTSAMYYLFNYLAMAHFGRGNLIAILAYGLTPLLLAVLFQALNNPDSLKYLIILGIIFIGHAVLTTHPPDFFVPLIIVLLFSLYYFYICANKKERKKSLRFFLSVSILGIVINLWWIIPMLRYLAKFSLEPYYKEQLYTLSTVKNYSIRLWEILRSMGNPLYFDIDKANKFFVAEVYYRLPFIIIGFVFPVIAYSALLFKGKNKYTIFFALLSIFGLFLSKGVSSPLGLVYDWLYYHIPGFFIFRAPYRVFTTIYVFALAPLIGLGIVRIADLVKNNLLSKLIIFSMWLCIFFYSWPLFTGTHLREKGSQVIGGVFFNIPPYYKEAKSWLAAQKDNFRIYLPVETYDVITDWGYHGQNPSLQLFDKAQLVYRPEATQWEKYQYFAKFLNETVKKWRFGNLSRILNLANVKYMLIQNDLHFWSFPSPNFNEYLSSLIKIQKGISLEKSIGKLEFYKNDYFSSNLFVTTNAELVRGGLDSLIPLSLTEYLDKPCLFLSDQLTPEQINYLSKIVKRFIWFSQNEDNPQRIIPLEFIEVLDSTKDCLNLCLPRASNYKIEILKFTYQEREKKYIYWNDTPVDLTKYSKLSLTENNQKSLPREFRIDLGIDTNGDGKSDNNLILTSKDCLRPEGIDIFEFAKNSLGPQDYFQVVSITFKPFYLNNISFFGEFGLKAVPDTKDPFILKLDNREFPINITQSNYWENIGTVHLEKGNHTLSFTPRKADYLLRLNPILDEKPVPLPKLSISKLNPTKYTIDVEAREPFFLVFSQSYHPDWQANIRGERVKYHYKVNGYANGYYINKTGRYRITLEFWPQRLFVIGAAISAVTFLILIILWIREMFQTSL
jgi:hypothetical protein